MKTGQETESVLEIFPWNRNLETGLVEIDEQHQVLVGILNRLAAQWVSPGHPWRRDPVLEELLDYARFHFDTEERLWQRYLGSHDMVRHHHDAHQQFFDEIERFRSREGPESEVQGELIGYLTHWLSFHILQADRRMALIVAGLRQGIGLSEARDRADQALEGATAMLVCAMLELYGKLSQTTVALIQERAARQRAESALARQASNDPETGD